MEGLHDQLTSCFGGSDSEEEQFKQRSRQSNQNQKKCQERSGYEKKQRTKQQRNSNQQRRRKESDCPNEHVREVEKFYESNSAQLKRGQKRRNKNRNYQAPTAQGDAVDPAEAAATLDKEGYCGTRTSEGSMHNQEPLPLPGLYKQTSADIRETEEFIKHFHEYQNKNSISAAGNFEEEDDYGDTEYKLKLVNPSQDRLVHLITQMKFRLEEGNGKAFYKIGVEDNGNPLGISKQEMEDSLKTLFIMAKQAGGEPIILGVRMGLEGYIAEVLVNRKEIQGTKVDLKIHMLGDEQSGKSTLVGVLISGKRDNGKGLARTNVFRHKHEIINGYTSSVSHQILGIDAEGRVTNQSQFGNLSWAEIVEASSKIVNFIDVAGHAKYMQTLIQGMCSTHPDYALLTISADQGITSQTENHLKIAYGMNVPVILVLTKADQVSETVLTQLTDEISQFLQQTLSNTNQFIIKSKEDVVEASRQMNDTITPIFYLSSVTFKGLDLFLHFLNLLPVNQEERDKTQGSDSEFHVNEQFNVDGELIVQGILTKGTVNIRQKMLLGPDREGLFQPVEIKNIQCKRVDVRQVRAGQLCSFSINLGKNADQWLNDQGGKIRRGMVLLSSSSKPRSTWTFEAEVWCQEGEIEYVNLNHQPVLHSNHVRQSVKFIHDNMEENKIPFLTRKIHSLSMNQEPITEIAEFEDDEDATIDFYEQDPNYSSQNIQTEEDHDLVATLQGKKKMNKRTGKRKHIRRQKKHSVGSYIEGRSARPSSARSHDGSEASNLNNIFGAKGASKHSRRGSECMEITYSKRRRVRMKFLHNPEYLVPGSHIIFNDNHLKAMGEITTIYYDTQLSPTTTPEIPKQFASIASAFTAPQVVPQL